MGALWRRLLLNSWACSSFQTANRGNSISSNPPSSGLFHSSVNSLHFADHLHSAMLWVSSLLPRPLLHLLLGWCQTLWFRRKTVHRWPSFPCASFSATLIASFLSFVLWSSWSAFAFDPVVRGSSGLEHRRRFCRNEKIWSRPRQKQATCSSLCSSSAPCRLLVLAIRHHRPEFESGMAPAPRRWSRYHLYRLYRAVNNSQRSVFSWCSIRVLGNS